MKHASGASSVPGSIPPRDWSWNGDQLDLNAYLRRINLDLEAVAAGPTAETLRLLHRSHVTAIPFENLEVILGRPILLDLPSLQDKLVRRPRGGYCYEHVTLFACNAATGSSAPPSTSCRSCGQAAGSTCTPSPWNPATAWTTRSATTPSRPGPDPPSSPPRACNGPAPDSSTASTGPR